MTFISAIASADAVGYQVFSLTNNLENQMDFRFFPSQNKLGPGSVMVPSESRPIFSAFLRTVCFLIGLFVSLQGHAQVFSSVSQSTTGGNVPYGGTMPVSLTATVAASTSNDAVSRLDLMEGYTTLASVYVAVTFNKTTGDPINIAKTLTRTANLGPGTHNIYLSALTYNGYSANSQTFTVTVVGAANVAPSATLSSPSNGVSLTVPAGTTASVNVSGSASDSDGTVSKIEVLDNGNPIVTLSNTTSINTSLSLGIGSHSLQLRATDDAGATGLSGASSVTVTAANQAPVATLDSPAGGSNAEAPAGSSASITVSGHASDPDGTISNLEILDNGSPIASVQNAASISTSVSLSIGSHSLQLRATDNQGATAMSASAPVTITQQANSIVFSSVNQIGGNGVVAPGGTISAGISATVRMSSSGDTVSMVQLYEGTTFLAKAPIGVVFDHTTGLPINSPRIVNLSANLGLGVHQLRLVADSFNGLDAASATFTITVTADAPPTATLNALTTSNFSVPAGTAASVAISGNAADTDGTVSQIEVLDNGNPISSVANVGSISTNVSLGVGTHSLQLRATDNLGVAGLSAAAAVTVVAINQIPVATLDSPATGANVATPSGSASVAVSGHASDPDGTISNLEILDNGNPIASVQNAPSISRSVSLSIGSHSLQLRATDNSGGVSVSSAAILTVTSSNIAPTAAFSAPSGGANYFAPVGTNASVTVIGSGSDADGTVVKMDLLDGGALVQTTNASTLNKTVPLSIGTHALQLRATDNGGATGLSSVLSIVVKAAPAVGAISSDVPVPIAISDADIPQLNNPLAGSLPGSLGAHDGSASYNIPLSVPPGTAGMVPVLSLDYSSDNTTGSAGLGWSLGGISNIDRCGTTVATDGRANAVRFADYVNSPTGVSSLQPVDRLCLDGQRLVLVNGDSTDNLAYWASGAEYRTEIENFSRVSMIISSGSGRRSFKVETKSGQTLYYGDTDDSYVNAVGRADGLAHRWRISRRADRSGNYISYQYSKDGTTGESKPTTIRWGANSTNGQAHYAQALFNYEARPDVRPAYVAGSPNTEALRLHSIVTSSDTAADGSGGVVANQYVLGYEISPSSGRSLLNSVQVCDGNNVCLPATKFQWGRPNPAAQRAFVQIGNDRVGPDLVALAGATGAGSNNTYVTAPMDSILSGDFDGDGNTDILERFRVAGNGYQQHLYQSSTDGKSWTVSTPFAQIAGPVVVLETGDFDGDGLLDVLIADQPAGQYMISNVRMCLGRLRTAAGFSCDTAVSFPADAFSTMPPPQTRKVKDFNADGRDDIFLRSTPSDPLYVSTPKYQCISTGTSFSCTDVKNTAYEVDFGDPNSSTAGTVAGSEYADIDGDGRVDKIYLPKCVWRRKPDGGNPPMEWYCGDFGAGDAGGILIFSETEVGGPAFSGSWFTFANNKTAVLAPPNSGALTNDLNGDGYSDMVFGSAQLQSNIPTSFAGNICYSKGNGTGDCRGLPLSTLDGGQGLGLDHLVLTMGDFDGDGQSDVLRPALDTWNNGEISAYQLCHVGPNNSYQRCETWQGPVFHSLSGSGRFAGSDAEDVFTRPRSLFLGDFDGDGKTDIASYLGGTRWQIFGAADQANPGEALDKLVSATNGFGHVERVEYATVNDHTVYSPAALDAFGQPIANSYPIKRLKNTRQLVKALHRDVGQGNWLDTTFSYSGAAVDATGRGNLGFARQDITEVQSGILTSTWSHQDYPFVGMQARIEVRSGGGVLLSKTIQSAGTQSVPQANGVPTLFPYLATSTVTKADLNGADLGTTTTTSAYSDGWGNLNQATSSSALNGGDVLNTTTTTVFDNNAAMWRLGEARSVTATKSVPGSTITRLVEYTYDGNGLLNTEVRQGNDPKLKVTSSYDRSGNVFGLVNSTTQTWVNPVTSSTVTRSSATVFDQIGRFPRTLTNAVGHITTLAFDSRAGTPSMVTTPILTVKTASADGFGRITSQVDEYGNEHRFSMRQCTANCIDGAATVNIDETYRSGIRVAAPTISYLDSAGHLLRSDTWGFDGRKIVRASRYDPRGRLFETDWPRFEGDSAVLSMHNEFDDLDRLTLSSTLNELGAVQSSTNQYQGTTIVRTNANLQKKTETRDVWGRLTNTVDALGQQVSFEYDAYSNLTKATDQNGNTILVQYDVLGRRTGLNDPDLGIVSYVVDPLGQVVQQVSPKQRAQGQLTSFSYDSLGRMIARDEPDLRSRWAYDKGTGGSRSTTCITSWSCGQLVQAMTFDASGNWNYQRVHSYDSLGRPTSTVSTLGTSYTSVFEYDSWGRVVRERHQRNGSDEKVFERRYNAYGYLSNVERGSLILWQANALDASQRVTSATLGNGLYVNRNYDPQTGRLSQGSVENSQGQAQLQEGYDYDALGNVKTRSQYWPGSAGFTEAFLYDSNNQLKSATVAGFPEQDFAYDSVGNLMSKTGVGSGSYRYPQQGSGSVQPHAVSNIPGIGDFHYDANGNLLDGAGRSLAWTSFDMPLSINKTDSVTNKTSSSTFVYGPEHQRLRQDRSDGTSISYAGSIEAETNNGVSVVKTYWPMGLGVEIDHAGVTDLNWTHQDRIGSIVAISDSSGNLREELAYDSWGKRRALTGNATPDSIDGVTDNKGFTGHEMLDQLDLVHMNGRVYDPLIARFVSPDPFIQDPTQGQSYNRYTYVWNNPTNMTDPTGFVGEGTAPCNQKTSCPGETAIGQLSCTQNGRAVDCHAIGVARGSDAKQNQGADNSGTPKPSANSNNGFFSQAGAAIKGEVQQYKNYLKYNLENPLETLENITAPFGAGGGVAGATELVASKSGKIGSFIGKLFSSEEAASDVFAGTKQASQYLRDIGVPRAARVDIMQSFEAGTINFRAAGQAEYGLRYYDGVKALDQGRYLFETFPATRASLALSSDWNKMTNVIQWQIRPGSMLLEGKAAAQGAGLPGGQTQKFIPYLQNLMKPNP